MRQVSISLADKLCGARRETTPVTRDAGECCNNNAVGARVEAELYVYTNTYIIMYNRVRVGMCASMCFLSGERITLT